MAHPTHGDDAAVWPLEALFSTLSFAGHARSNGGLGLYDALAILGRERSLARIRRASAAG